jgi:uncharacterized protein
MKKTIAVAALVFVMIGLGKSQDIAGDWQGILNAGGVQLHLVLHINKDSTGSLTAILVSPDQSSKGMPVSSISIKDSKLKFAVDRIQGSYQGKLNADATKISGTWYQGAFFDLDFKRANPLQNTSPKPAAPSDIDGAWMGAIDTGVAKLTCVFHITNTADGLTATMDSPDQGASGIPVTTVTRNGPTLKMQLEGIGGVFDGKISTDLTTIDGTWNQSGRSFPLLLKRVKDATQWERRRPQNPVKPYPYREEEVSYDNKAQGVTLAATLTIPPGKEPFPAVLLIVGSGPHDRDESLLGHKPFLVLSDYLTRKGIVVLRADKRGVGKSTGSLATATTADFATDAEAGVAYLKTRSEVDPHKIGLAGHSEGGEIAPMVAARNPDVAFIVLMAGPGVPGDQLLPQQELLIWEASGMGHDAAEKKVANNRAMFTLIEREKDDAVLDKELRERLATDDVPKAQVGAAVKQLTSPWFRYFLSYDPATALRKVTCPVLALNGEKDLQVPPTQNLPAIRAALEAGGNKHFEVDEMPGLNHLFQTAKTGAPSEYAEIEETMSPVVLEKIASWILKQ